MSDIDSTGGGKSPLSLFLWAILIVALAVVAYFAGAGMARRWATVPSLARPLSVAPLAPTPAPTRVSSVWLVPSAPVEDTLGEDTADNWRFRGVAGQSVTIEMWLHPGSGSSVETELAVHLIASDGTVLASETGSVFVPPYLTWLPLPSDDLYYIQVEPTSGAPGRYSLLLTLSDALPLGTPGTPLPPQLTRVAPGGPAAAAFQGQFQWPSTRRAISGWTFHDPGNPGHIGLDIAAEMWDPIVASADGIVTFAEWGGGYGNLVIVEHDGDWRTYYAHFTEIVVTVGQEVRQGELLGGAGTTGYSTGPHLHFEIRYQGRPVDPHVHLP
ncbi:MAG: M23 family metallopeptidase [Chloroflexi bacterium]|nr:M23 family metallopeptidase [Chloroflexota bacterium]